MSCTDFFLGFQISIHALREEGDAVSRLEAQAAGRFLSTPSARRATQACGAARPPGKISIHALREEGDHRPQAQNVTLIEFLSTPSARRATATFAAAVQDLENFYPRPPRGGRPAPAMWYRFSLTRFLSTPSARRATAAALCNADAAAISIHALREEGDTAYPVRKDPLCLFLSTPSARRATRGELDARLRILHFYPRPPRGGRQQKQRQNLYFLINYTTFCTNLEEP